MIGCTVISRIGHRFFCFCRVRDTAVYLHRRISSLVSLHNSGSAGLPQLCFLRDGERGICCNFHTHAFESLPAATVTGTLHQPVGDTDWPQPRIAVLQPKPLYNIALFTRQIPFKPLFWWLDRLFLLLKREANATQERIDSKDLFSSLVPQCFFGMNTNVPNRNGSIKDVCPTAFP